MRIHSIQNIPQDLSVRIRCRSNKSKDRDRRRDSSESNYLIHKCFSKKKSDTIRILQPINYSRNLGALWFLTTEAAVWVANFSAFSNQVFGVRNMNAMINRQNTSYCQVPRS